MLRFLTGILLLTVLASAGEAPGQRLPESKANLIRISPSIDEKPKADTKLLEHGTRVTVHAVISKTGDVTKIKFVKGNSDLMPEVRKALKRWRYKPYIYQGHPMEVDTTIFVSFDPLTGD